MNYKAVVSDLDGTLLNSNHEISEFNINIINELKEKGIEVFIATGRHHVDVKAILKVNNLKTGIITSNGAVVFDIEGNEIIRHEINKELIKDFFDKIDVKDTYVNMYIGDKWYINKRWPEVEGFHDLSGFDYEVTDFNALFGQDVTKIFITHPNHDVLVEVEKEVLNHYSNELSVTFSDPNCLEIMSHGVNKANSLEELIKLDGIKVEETIAFGDGFNDYEMLKRVGAGFVMGNAHYKLKDALVNHEIIGTNDENGVGMKLKEIFK